MPQRLTTLSVGHATSGSMIGSGGLVSPVVDPGGALSGEEGLRNLARQLRRGGHARKEAGAARLSPSPTTAAAEPAEDPRIELMPPVETIPIAVPHSKVWSRVGESSRRVKRMEWGHPLFGVIKNEQFKKVEAGKGTQRRLGVFMGDSAVLNLRDPNATKKKNEEKVFFGSKVVLRSAYTDSFLCIGDVEEGEGTCSLSENPTCFALVNLTDPESTSPIAIGDSVGLAITSSDMILGTRFSLSKKQQCVAPIENDERAQLTGAWIVVNPDSVYSAVPFRNAPHALNNMETILLEHSSTYLSAKDNAILLQGPGRSAVESGCLWTVQLVSHSAKKENTSTIVRAQIQMHDVRAKQEGCKVRISQARKDMRNFQNVSDAHYLAYDPTSIPMRGEQSVLSHLSQRLSSLGDRIEPQAQQRLSQKEDKERHNLAVELQQLGNEPAHKAATEESTPQSPASASSGEPEEDKVSKLLSLLGRGSKKRADRPKKKLVYSLEQVRVQALTHRLTLQVPSVVWEHIIIQDTIIKERERDTRERNAVLIQRQFRKWKQDRWIRNFSVADKECERLALDDSNKEAGNALKKLAKNIGDEKSRPEASSLRCPPSTMEERLRNLVISQSQDEKDRIRREEHLRLKESVKERKAAVKAFSDKPRTIQSYYGVLSQSDRPLFKGMPHHSMLVEAVSCSTPALAPLAALKNGACGKLAGKARPATAEGEMLTKRYVARPAELHRPRSAADVIQGPSIPLADVVRPKERRNLSNKV